MEPSGDLNQPLHELARVARELAPHLFPQLVRLEERAAIERRAPRLQAGVEVGGSAEHGVRGLQLAANEEIPRARREGSFHAVLAGAGGTEAVSGRYKASRNARRSVISWAW